MQEGYEAKDDEKNDPHRGAGPSPVHEGVEGGAAQVVLGERWMSGQGKQNKGTEQSII